MSLRKKGERGFTLMETAIMLGIASFILASIWAAGSAVWTNYQVDKALQQVVTVTQNIREFYNPLGAIRNAAGAVACAGAGDTDITNLLDDAGRRLLPADMLISADANDDPVNHAMAVSASGSFHVYCRQSGTVFRLELTSLSREKCVKFALGLPLLDPAMRIERLQINSSSTSVNALSLSSPGGSWTLPLTVTSAQGYCNQTTGTNAVLIDYTL